MNKETEKKLLEDVRLLKDELLYITKIVGIEYCQCEKRENAEDAGSLDRDDNGYFFKAPSWENQLRENRIEFCPFCGKRLFLFRRKS
ncbi:MAG: hypothetical protein KAR42_16935 [candidate division Zixibacteria bacterium]|nr:hypothetical protein [candidate division Zixibacteria bacterium]